MIHNPPFIIRRRPRRRGVVSMLAMIYLVIFTTLAVGFYASATVSSQISANERRGMDAQLAAETGMDFMRNALYQVVVAHRTPNANVLDEIEKDLKALLENTGNLGQNTVGLNNSGTGARIEVPYGSTSYINIGNGRKFRAEIRTRGTTNDLVVTVTGISDGVSGGSNVSKLRMEYERDEAPTDFFRNGMVSNGPVIITTKNLVQGLPANHAQIVTLSTANPPVTIGTSSGSSYGGVAGDIYLVQGAPNPLVYPNWSVGGSTMNNDILANHVFYKPAADMPPLPVPVTSIYKDFATNPYVAGLASYKNIIIPANTNPIFNGPTDIKGVVYIKQPNKVTFAGNCTVTGVIVGEDTGVGTIVTNAIIFAGNGGVKAGVEALPDLPEFAGLKLLPGSFIVAPGFDVQLTGNFGSISGHIAGDKVTLSGATNSNITGSIVALKGSLTIGGNTTATLVHDATQGHAGLRVEDRYVPVPGSYVEFK
jgi:Tfp pilus assembly protein PilX